MANRTPENGPSTRHEDALNRIYSSYSETHSVYSGNIYNQPSGRLNNTKKIVSLFFPQNNNSRILEIGCGDGSLLDAAMRAGYSRLRGIDSSRSMITQIIKSRESLDHAHLPNVSCDDALEYILSMKPASLEFIVAIDVIEHLTLPKLLDILDAAQKALVPNGEFLIRAPNGSSPFAGHIIFGDLTHYTAFTQSSLTQLCKVTGFSGIRISEDRPAIHGGFSLVRALAWRVVRLFWIAFLAVETGNLRGHVLTMNMFAVLKK